jgi:uncharacterized protein (TIGR03032 family)
LSRPDVRDGWDVVVAKSAWHRQTLIDTFGLRPDRVEVLRNGVGPSFENLFSGSGDLAEAKRGSPRLVYTSTPFRGLEVLLDAFEGLPPEFPGLELRVYSSMRVYQMDEKTDPHQALYDRCRSQPGVVYIGSLPQPQLARELRRYDILAYPSTFAETCCTAAMESMAAGLIVVASDLGALRETTRDLGELVDPLAGKADRAAFVDRFRDALRRVLAERARDPAVFARRQYRQVETILADQTWPALTAEWESAIARWRQPAGSTPAADRPSLHWTVSPGLANWLVEVQASVAFTSSGLGRLMLLSAGEPGKITVVDRPFEGSAALWSDGQTLWLATLFQLWRFERIDGVYLPRVGHVIGEHDVRDLTVNPAGDVLFISGAMGCVARLHPRHGVQHVWTPDLRLTARLGPLRLTGLAVAPGKPLVVTATAGATGLLLDVELDRVIAEGPFEVIAPRYHQDRLWLLDMASRHVGTMDPESGQFERRAACPGKPRSLVLTEDYAVVTLLPNEGKRPGFVVLDLETGTLVESLWVEGKGVDICGVALLPGAVRPTLVGVEAEELRRFLPLHSGVREPVESKQDPAVAVSAEAFVNLGNQHKDQKRYVDAADAYRQALALRPDALVEFRLGRVLHAQGKYEEAADAFGRGLKSQPDHAEGLNWLADSLLAMGRFDEAQHTISRAFALRPRFPEAEVTIGLIYQARRQWKEALDAYDRALALRPGFIPAEINKATVLSVLGRPAESAELCRQVLEKDPSSAIAWNNLGNMYKLLGRLEEARDTYRRALAIQPDFVVAHNNALYCQQYVTGVTTAELAESHREWDRRHAARYRSSWPDFSMKRKTPSEPIRLGFVSEDLCLHPVGFFLVRVLEHLDRKRFDVVCYSGRLKEDEFTQRIRAASTLWRLTPGVSDQALADRIRADGIDILFDLSGHTQGSRLLVFARKPAPIQITWMGYVGTTGLAAMDYLLADRFQVPPETEKDYTETILRMPDDYVCYDIPADAPPVGELPARKRGSITFGSFNNGAKINAEVLALWAEVLRRIPGSRLLLQYFGLEDSDTQKRFRERLAAAGVDPARMAMHGWAAHQQLLERYNEVDVALDTFPYSGGLTTCEALWMGVPVVTWPGQTFAGRHSLSHLSNVGLTETIARDREHYVELAVGLANDLDHLAEIRAGLRQRMANSPLCDGPRFTRHFMEILEKLEPRPAPPMPAPDEPLPLWGAEALRGQELHQQGKSVEAAAAYHRSLELNPSQPDVANNLGVILRGLGKFDEAARSFDRALELRPEFPDAMFNRASLLHALGQLSEAIPAYRLALQYRPHFPAAANLLGRVLTQTGVLVEGERWCRTALEQDPQLIEAEVNLGIALGLRKQLGEAEACFRHVLTRIPAHAVAHKNLGTVLGTQGRHDEAAEEYASALRLQPNYVDAHSAAVALELYRDGVTPARLAEVHREWASRHAENLRNEWKSFANVRDPDRPLRLGFVSGDFRRHPVGFLLLRTLAHLDRQQWVIHCYHTRPGEDEFTQRFQALATQWRTVQQPGDPAFADLIRADAIDILIDLSGHTVGNRMLTFARKPAPVQLTWLGYPSTTGLTAIDYLIADAHHVRIGEEDHFMEKVLRLPGDYVCYDPPANVPAIRQRTEGPITFGCFNNPTKITQAVIATWGDILRSKPRARLMLRYGTFRDTATRLRLEREFARHGISADRLDLGTAEFPAILDLYNEVDVALDTFPYSGGLTTCEALLMGVPVVTWPGQTFAGRHSLSHLSCVGLTETIATDRDDYVELAVNLADDIDRLAELRAGLRQRMADSPLCDGASHARHLSDALRDVWRSYCEQGA